MIWTSETWFSIVFHQIWQQILFFCLRRKTMFETIFMFHFSNLGPSVGWPTSNQNQNTTGINDNIIGLLWIFSEQENFMENQPNFWSFWSYTFIFGEDRAYFMCFWWKNIFAEKLFDFHQNFRHFEYYGQNLRFFVEKYFFLNFFWTNTHKICSILTK